MGFNRNNIYSPCIALLVVFFLSACEKNTVDELKQGDVFPLSALVKLATNTSKPPSFTAKTLVINIWASWCTPCRKEMPELQRLSDALDKDKFIVIGVSVDDDKNLMQEFLLQHHISFVNYHDADQYLSRDMLAVSIYPETFIISPQGIIIRRIVGEQPWNSKAMHSMLESIHEGKDSKETAGHLVKK